MADLSDNAQKVLEMVEKMTVLELADLVKAMEEKFSVPAVYRYLRVLKICIQKKILPKHGITQLKVRVVMW